MGKGSKVSAIRQSGLSHLDDYEARCAYDDPDYATSCRLAARLTREGIVWRSTRPAPTTCSGCGHAFAACNCEVPF